MATFKEMIQNRVEMRLQQFLTMHTNYGDPEIIRVDITEGCGTLANIFTAWVRIGWDGIANRDRFTGIGKEHVIYGIVDGFGDASIASIISAPRPFDVDIVEGERLNKYNFDFLYGKEPEKK